MKEAITYRNVRTKTDEKFGWARDGQHVELRAGRNGSAYIRLFGEKERHNHERGKYMQGYDRTFKVGDAAEYDSYNLHYFGRIVAIGAKTVTIEAHGRNRRLDIARFSDRNWDDPEKKAEHNRNWMD